MEDYDFNKFEEMVVKILENREWDDELDYGENISPISEIKIAFDGYGDLETENEDGSYEYVEHGNTDLESYAIYIHKESAKRGFEFPEHEVASFTFGSMVIHRPKEEVCLFAWRSKHEDGGWYWDVIPLEDRLDSDNTMTTTEVMNILEVLVNRYFSE
jgi:hypothetical protein